MSAPVVTQEMSAPDAAGLVNGAAGLVNSAARAGAASRTGALHHSGTGRRRARPHPVPDPRTSQAPTDAQHLSVTITLDGGDSPGADRLLAALHQVIDAAGPDASVELRSIDPAPAPAAPGGTAIRLDPRPRAAHRGGEPLDLSRLEYDLLLFFARHPQQVFTRSQLLAQVWGHVHTSMRTVDVHVSRLRGWLDDPDLIITVYGVGYRLADDASISVA